MKENENKSKNIGVNIFDIFNKYPNQYSVIKEFINRKYPDGVFCPHCGSTQVSHRKLTPKKFQCNACNNSFSVFKSTILQKTRVDLRKWVFAIHCVINGKKGMSALQLQRGIGGSYRTSWRMFHQIRKAMLIQSERSELETIIQVDETYVGGKPRKGEKDLKRGRGTKKTPVVGVYNKGENTIHAQVALPNKDGQKLTGKQLLSIIEKVASKNSQIHTDEFRSYRILTRTGYTHLVVNHSAGEYAKNGVHVNQVENFWSLLKRGVFGSFHHISEKYMQAYVNEFSWRYNNRLNENIFDDLMNLVIA